MVLQQKVNLFKYERFKDERCANSVVDSKRIDYPPRFTFVAAVD